jgi:7,8-dihydro-6-hydroxymethylpterin-pyrophosphokinase
LRMHERRFVLQPACDLIPETVCPRSNLSLLELLARCTDDVSRPVRIAERQISI